MARGCMPSTITAREAQTGLQLFLHPSRIVPTRAGIQHTTFPLQKKPKPNKMIAARTV
jgi:hypothetical protein